MHLCSLCACPKLLYIVPKSELSLRIPSELKRFKLN